MSVAVVTGSGRLGGSETVRFLADTGLGVADFNNDMRAVLCGRWSEWSADTCKQTARRRDC